MEKYAHIVKGIHICYHNLIILCKYRLLSRRDITLYRSSCYLCFYRTRIIVYSR